MLRLGENIRQSRNETTRIVGFEFRLRTLEAERNFMMSQSHTHTREHKLKLIWKNKII